MKNRLCLLLSVMLKTSPIDTTYMSPFQLWSAYVLAIPHQPRSFGSSPLIFQWIYKIAPCVPFFGWFVG